MRSRMMAVVIGLCLIGFAGGASAQTQINIASVTSPDLVHTKAAFWFKECVEKAAPGKLSVAVHHSASLGSETQVLQQIQLGTTQISVCTTGPIEAFVPEIKALEMPFVLPSYEAADKVLDGAIGQELGKKFEKSGFMALAFLDNGFRNVTNSKRPVKTPEDLKALKIRTMEAPTHLAIWRAIGQELGKKFEKSGFVALAFLDNGFRNVTNSKRPVKTPEDLKALKIRTMEAPTHLAIWRAIGANPTPMAWPIFTQLQQGVIDGQENPISVIHGSKLQEAGQKYLTLTRHVYSALVFVANKAFIEGLPPAERKVVMDCARTASLQGRSHIRDNEAKQIAELSAAGMQVEDKPDLAAFRKATAPVIETASGDTKKLVEQIQQTVK